ncbi:MAG TPA: hypothetical protein VEL07_08135 [Planctomycetota bacterium]|nr:hypothetical protein [Planctomycetota bacterium]
MTMRALTSMLCGLLALGASGISAAESAPAATTPAVAAAPLDPRTPVAAVDGAPLTLRQLEDALLEREGADLIEDLVHERLGQTPWIDLKDEDVLLEIAGMRLRRGLLAAQLLRQKAADVREELINISVVDQALKREGVVVGDAEIAAELTRMRASFDQRMAARDDGVRMQFDDYIQQSQQMPVSEFARQPGFRMGAGLHIMAERRIRAELTPEMMRAYFERNRADYDVAEAVDLSLISIPYEKIQIAPGPMVVTEAERRRLFGVLRDIRASIADGAAFAKAWQLWGRGWDPDAAPDGRIGWIGRDGARSTKGAKPVPAAAVAAAFAATGTEPILLDPIAHDEGVVLLLVHGRRAAKAAEFAAIEDRVRDDIVAAAIEGRTQRLLGELRGIAQVDYESLPPLIERRAAETGLDAAVPAVAPQAAAATE